VNDELCALLRLAKRGRRGCWRRTGRPAPGACACAPRERKPLKIAWHRVLRPLSRFPLAMTKASSLRRWVGVVLLLLQYVSLSRTQTQESEPQAKSKAMRHLALAMDMKKAGRLMEVS